MNKAYRIMWVQVIFDLPTGTKKERREAMLFRTKLIEFGFQMLQFSVYMKCCATNNALKKVKSNVKSYLPQYGKVSILHFTDKQYELIESFYQRNPEKDNLSGYQMEFF